MNIEQAIMMIEKSGEYTVFIHDENLYSILTYTDYSGENYDVNLDKMVYVNIKSDTHDSYAYEALEEFETKNYNSAKYCTPEMLLKFANKLGAAK